MKLEVIHKKSYGQNRFYPANLTAEYFLVALDKKSFTTKQLAQYKRAGIEIIVKQQSYQLEDGDEQQPVS